MIKLTKVRPHRCRDTRVIALLRRRVVLLSVFQLSVQAPQNKGANRLSRFLWSCILWDADLQTDQKAENINISLQL